MRDANAELLKSFGQDAGRKYSLCHDFITNEIVYAVEGVKAKSFDPDTLELERYRHGDTLFKVFINIERNGHFGKYVATLSNTGIRPPNDTRQHWVVNAKRKEMQARMLKAIVEPVQNPKRVRSRGIPTLVRLYIDNEVSCPLWQVLQGGLEVPNCFLSLRLGQVDGEHGIISRLSNSREQSANEVIKSSSHVMNGLVSEDLDNLRPWGTVKAIEIMRSFLIYLTPPGTWIGRDESIEGFGQLADLFTCPSEFEDEPEWWDEGGVSCSHGRQISAS